jgi:hypothetical protein
VVVLYAVVLLVPGGALGVAAGLRGWTAIATAPLLTYALLGVAGPATSSAGSPWDLLTAAAVTVVATAAVAGARLLLRRTRRGRGSGEPHSRPGPPTSWSPLAHACVAAAVLFATGVGVVALLGGIGTIGAIPQDWDAAFHANGIRYIAETGDGGLYGMTRTNWFEGNVALYYPNAYHLVAVLVYGFTGSSVPTILNAGSALTGGLLALTLVALVRRFGGRPVLAAAAALVGAASSAVYDVLWHGPLLPFAAGVVLLPVAVILVVDVLDATGLRGRLAPALLLAAGLAGYMCLHPSVLISAALMTAPALVQRWWSAPRRIPAELRALAVTGLAAVLLCAQEIAAALSTGGNSEKLDRPPALSTAEAVGQLVTFGHGSETIQLALALFLALGLIGFRRLGPLRWVGGSAVLFGLLFVLTASVTEPWARLIASIWWNDSWRPVALAAVPMAVLAGNGVAQLQVLVARPFPVRPAVGLATAAAALAVLVAGTGWLDLGRNQDRLRTFSGDGPAVSAVELEGMQAVAAIVGTGSRVMNDRGDGSAWMYALTGVHTVAEHYDNQRIGPAAELLGAHFNEYAQNPAVRAAVAELGIRYVQLDEGFIRPAFGRQAGLVGLAGRPWLRLAYRNPAVTLYEIVPAGAPAT